MYEWPTNIQASLYISLSGYLVSTGYVINQVGQNTNINLVIGYPEDPTHITDRTIAIDIAPSFDLVDSKQLGGGFWEYSPYIEYSIYTKTDRDVEVLLFNMSEHFKECPLYYNWSIAVTGTLADGLTGSSLSFESNTYSRIRNEKFETNVFLNHRGLAKTKVLLDSDSLL